MKSLSALLIAVFCFGIFTGSFAKDDPKNTAKQFNSNTSRQIVTQSDHNNPASVTGVPYYFDNFNFTNDSVGLASRGYTTYRNGTASGNTSGVQTWFQGNAGVFPAFSSPDTSYVGSNYQSAGNLGNIDNWLVLPPLNVVSGDSLFFYSRSVEQNPFPDSIRVMYNPTGATLPSDPNWVELGRFLATPSGSWELRGFRAPSSGFTATWAIRYAVVSGGLFGDNSNYIGIDDIVVSRDQPLPVELSSFTSSVSGSSVTLNWSTSSELNNSRFEIERSSNGVWSKVGTVNGNGTTSSVSNYSFTERGLATGAYSYRLKQVDFNGNYEYFNLSSEVVIGVPSEFSLAQNYPNPFNPSTTISFQLPVAGNTVLAFYDMNGKEVKSLVNGFREAGYYSVNLNASDLSSGVYFYSLKSGNFVQTKKLSLVK